jgi:RNA polymerase sigma-70 factor (sigma-E family)
VQADREREYVEFVSARLPAMRRLAYLLCGDGHHADDLVQQAFTALFVHWHRARAAAHLDGYVRRMVVRTFLNERRRAWSRRVDLTACVPEWPAQDGPDLAERTAVRDALAQVPPRQRAVLVLRYLCDLPVAEVAAILDCSPGTVKSQASHGLAALRRLFGEPAASVRVQSREGSG